MSTALDRIGQLWRNPEYPLRQRDMIEAAPEFFLSPSSFELAMDSIFAHWTEENIQKLSQKVPSPPLKKGEITVQILAGTTPAMIAQGFLQGALLGAQLDAVQYLKLPRQQTLFAYLLYQSFQENAPELAALFILDNGQKLNQFYTVLAKAQLVIIYGNDETIATIHSYVTPETLFFAHGHAESAAIIFQEAANLDSLKKLAYDMLSYDQRGCLSPRAVFVEEGGELSPEECAQQFAEIVLPHVALQLPRGGLLEGEAAEILHQRMLYGFRGKVYSGLDWTVTYEPNLIWPLKIALPRFMPFQPFKDTQDLILMLHSLISIGYAGPSKKIALLKNAAKYFCVLGEMQKQCLFF